MIVGLIAATAYCPEVGQFVIGVDGEQPFRSSVDMRRFRDLTLSQTVVMGRRTYESLGCEPLPDRTNIILSHRDNFFLLKALTARSLKEALLAARKYSSEAWVIGGGEVYKRALDLVLPDMIYLSEMKEPCHFDGQGEVVVFPRINMNNYLEYSTVECEDHFLKVFHKNPFRDTLQRPVDGL